jgi:mono/diheme cytochrome c family protein
MKRLFSLTIVLLAAWTASAFRSVAAEDAALPADGTPISRSDLEFFENSIRPLLVNRCYACHSAAAEDVEGDLLLDSRPGIAAGGASGEVISGRDPDASLLIEAVRWENSSLQMPPDGRLSGREIAALERWVSMGVPDPREAAAGIAAKDARRIDVDQGRAWWSFQPVKVTDVEALRGSSADDSDWPQQKIDHFILAKLAEHDLAPSAPAERDVLMRRAYLDLTGLRPTFEQVQSFVSDDSADAYARLIEQLLESPHYGERWGRYWLDVVRYGEDNFTGEATTPAFPFAWRYRDWVIEAINRDVPYDRFVKLQLAADLMPDVERREQVALGFLGAAPSYHKDGRLSKDVVETLYTDDWDERVDAVSRGLMGLTVSCARCHDHKFDPITAADYYSLAGVFASTVQAPRPLSQIDAAAETQFMVDANRVFYLSYAARLLRDDPGSKPQEAREKVLRFRAEMEEIKRRNAHLQDSHPELYRHLSALARKPSPYPDEPAAAAEEDGGFRDRDRQSGRRRGGSSEPLFQAVFDAGFYVDGSDPDFTMLDIRPGEPRDLDVLHGGNVTRPGDAAPRGFLSVLAKHDRRFQHGSGRLELANCLFDDARSLVARVIVNRVWGWHFGTPLVATPSDFGSQGERPTHPELLDDLAARFIDSGYSLKWLHRDIMLSQTYRQSSRPRQDAMTIDPANALLWRMNPRRLDIEAYRDCILLASGDLDTQMAGPSEDLDRSNNHRRTVYGRIRRGRPASLLQLYDFPSPKMHSPMRETTTSPLQQLFIMNSDFIREQSEALVDFVTSEAGHAVDTHVVDPGECSTRECSTGEYSTGDHNASMVVAKYRRVFGRDPSPDELRLGEQFLQTATPTQFAQALFATNEMIFWP